jgi:hypothetical protein
MPGQQATEVAATLGPISPPQKLQRSSAGRQRANPRDLTGKRKQELEAQAAEERKIREAEMAQATQAAAEYRETSVVDYSEGGHSAPGTDVPEAEEVPEEIEVQDPIVQIRVNSPIEDMVFGRSIAHPGDPEHGIPPTPGPLQFYSFQEGVTYKVPRAMAEHLDRLGYLWH